MKTACVYHSIDLDGWMSAAIVKHWFNESNDTLPKVINIGTPTIPCYQYKKSTLSMIGYNYGDPIPNLSEYDKVIMVDISFKDKDNSVKPMIELYESLKAKHGKFIYIDHHISNINDIKLISEKGDIPFYGLVNTKFAACELTWKYFFPNEPMPELVRLLGRYDCFGHKGTDEEQYVLHVQYGARSVISNYKQAYEWLQYALKDEFLSTYEGKAIHQQLESRGLHIYDYLCTEAKQVYKNGFKHTFSIFTPSQKGGTTGLYFNPTFICINRERFNPINFGIDYHADGYDGCACFHYDGVAKLWRFSLYNDNGEVDCSLIANQFGGGGHKGAAGFVINDLTLIFK